MSEEGGSVGVSIVTPCLDEARTIERCVARALEALAEIKARYGLSGEVVVADNGSADGSRELAEAAGARVVRVETRGYGAALSGGMQAARGRYLVMGDADLSYDFVESVGMIGRLEAGADICMGDRFAGGIAPGAMPWKNRYIGNPALSGVLRVLFGSPVKDAHCGIRALTRDAFDRLRLGSRGMEFASEMVIKAALSGMRVDQVPVTLSPDERGRPPHLRPWRDGWRHLRFMLMLSPGWLFFAPALLFGFMGLVIITALILGLDREMVSVGPLALGDHWMIVASALVVIAFQLAFFGLAALLYSFREGWRRPSISMSRVLGAVRMEHWMIAGTILTLAGALWAGIVAWGWAASGFGPLDAARELGAAFMLIVLGVQAFFGGFLLAILGGVKAKFDPGVGA